MALLSQVSSNRGPVLKIDAGNVLTSEASLFMATQYQVNSARERRSPRLASASGMAIAHGAHLLERRTISTSSSGFIAKD
ncbi:hypothetical protein ACDY97_14460 [Rhizobium mongolense]|uniref:hypothetical protein n=1 Tax=Rhizobium TaxID=379 RepID=UPI00093B5B1D|nr:MULTISPECIES: hypothetical protein [Rhizobium]WFU89749.1 hypothetical protein QA644_27240 [Rhizobium sp. CC1099]